MKVKSWNSPAFSLVEVTLALGVATFCLIAILGLLPVGINSNQASIEQTAAASLARALVADLRATPKTNPPTDQTSPEYQIVIPAAGTATRTIFLRQDGMAAASEGVDAASNASPNLNPRYRATLVFVAPEDTSQKIATTVRILITWPAMADKTANASPDRYAGSYETLTALYRN